MLAGYYGTNIAAQLRPAFVQYHYPDSQNQLRAHPAKAGPLAIEPPTALASCQETGRSNNPVAGQSRSNCEWACQCTCTNNPRSTCKLTISSNTAALKTSLWQVQCTTLPKCSGLGPAAKRYPSQMAREALCLELFPTWPPALAYFCSPQSVECGEGSTKTFLPICSRRM